MGNSKKMKVIERDGLRCSYCRKKLTFHEFYVDHIHPRALGGKYHMENLAGSCKTCNEMKGCMTVDEFIAKQQRKVSRLNAERNYLMRIIKTHREKYGKT